MFNPKEKLARQASHEFQHDSVCKYDLVSFIKEGQRYYNILRYDDFASVTYKSVTTILSEHSDNTYLKNWRELVGEEEANKISGIACTRWRKYTSNSRILSF